LLGRPFHVREALALGLTRNQLQSRCWVRLFRGVYVHSSVPITDAIRYEAIRLFVPADAAVTGLTAAWLFGVWTPPPGQPVPLEFGLPLRRSAFIVSAGRGRRIVLDDGDTGEFGGFLVTTPERTCFGLMAATTPTEAVVWADAFLQAGLATPNGLRRYADERPHWPQVRKVRTALTRARVGARSPMETRLRLVVVDGGLPEPTWLNKRFYDARGNLLGEVDMGYDHPGVTEPWFGMEFDGAYHGTADQRAADDRRENGLLIGGVPLLRYTKDDVYRRPQLIVHEVGAMLRKGLAA
jgi:hypothetical protein